MWDHSLVYWYISCDNIDIISLSLYLSFSLSLSLTSSLFSLSLSLSYSLSVYLWLSHSFTLFSSLSVPLLSSRRYTLHLIELMLVYRRFFSRITGEQPVHWKLILWFVDDIVLLLWFPFPLLTSITLILSLSVYLGVCLSIYVSVCLSVRISVCISVCLFVYLSLDLFMSHFNL